MRELTFPGKAVGSCSLRVFRRVRQKLEGVHDRLHVSLSQLTQEFPEAGEADDAVRTAEIRPDVNCYHTLLRQPRGAASCPVTLLPAFLRRKDGRYGLPVFSVPACRERSGLSPLQGKKSGRPFPYKRKKRPLSCQPFQAVTRELPTISFRSFTMAILFFCFLSLPIPASLSS